MTQAHSARRRLAAHDLIYTAAPPEWAFGVPMGNGHLGAMLWGDGSPLCLTIDRDDLWDLRHEPVDDPEYTWKKVRAAVSAGDTRRISEILDRNLDPVSDSGEHPVTPTKLPLGRMEVSLPLTGEFSGRLHLGDATFRGRIGEVRVEAFVASESPVIVAKFSQCPSDPHIQWRSLPDINPDDAARLDLGVPELHESDNDCWAVQRFPDGGCAVIAWRTLRRGDTVTLLITVTTHDDPPDPVALARDRLAEAASRTTRITASHADWWEDFWSRSAIQLPDGELETLWHYGLYKLASSSRPGHRPAPLQGVWVTDGVLPPWRGDYHANMNVQETYWPVYATNHLELGVPLYDWLERIAPGVEARTKSFFGFDGIRMETAVAADGTNVPGWSTVQFWPGASTWLGHHLWLHWRYSQDRTFLRERAYPYLRACMTFWEGFLEPDADGVLHVPLSHSPEWMGNDPDAWGSDTVIDLSLIRGLCDWCIEAAELLGIDSEDRRRWTELKRRLAPYPKDNRNGSLALMKSIETGDAVTYTESHRHPSHLMPIFPLHDISIDGGDADRHTIDASIHEIEKEGMGLWTGWSFPYFSLIASRAGRAEMAEYMLRLYIDCFVLPNGMHVNGDWRWRGVGCAHYQPFTMEAECAATAAVTEMLLQSWGGVIRLFPGVPRTWRDCAFDSLLAEGGITVSATRVNGRANRVELTARHDTDAVVTGIGETASWSGAVAAEWRDGAWHVRLRARTTAIATGETEDAGPSGTITPRVENVFGYRGPDAW